MENLLEKFGSLTRYWWGILLLGILIVLVGITVFINLKVSLITLAILFAVIILLSGALELTIAFTEHYLPGRGWIGVSGIIQLVLGILLLVKPVVTVAVIPYLLAFWLLFHGISLIGLAVDMRRFKVSGMGWTIFLSVLILLCAIMILFNPMIGAVATVIIVGVAILAAGISTIAFSIDLYGIRKREGKLVE